MNARICIDTLAVCAFMLLAYSLSPDTWAWSQDLVIRDQIPFGDTESSLLTRGMTITGLLCVESLSQRDMAVDYRLEVPDPLKPEVKDRHIQIKKTKDGWMLRACLRLSADGEKWFRPIEISIPEDCPYQRYSISSTARVRGTKMMVRHIARLKVVSTEEMKDSFCIGDVAIPADEEGEPDDRQEQNTLMITGKKRFWQMLVRQDNAARPATYMAVTLKNRSDYRAILLTKLDILDPKTDKRIKGFEYPYAAEHSDLLGRGEIYEIAGVPSRGERRVVLPIYTRQVLPGTYLARIEVLPLGTSMVVARRDIELRAVSTRWMPILMTSTGLLIAVLGSLFFYCKRRYLFSMNTRDLILIALFGTMMFAVVNVPGTILFNVAHVVLGPFSFLLTGLFYEMIFYLLLISLLVIIPRVGTIFLVIMVRFLMSSFVLGEFTPMSLIYYPLMATVLEGMAYILGISRGNIDLDRRQILVVASVLGLTDAYLSLVFFNLSMLFYRLYYANWYIVTYLIIDGFLFTFLAVPPGIRLGKRLRSVSVI